MNKALFKYFATVLIVTLLFSSSVSMVILSDQMMQTTRTVMHNGQVMELTNKEYQLLLYLVENHTRVVERDEILNHIWGYDFIGESRVLDVHIRALRAKLDDDGSKYIKTIRGVGYRYVEEVK